MLDFLCLYIYCIYIYTYILFFQVHLRAIDQLVLLGVSTAASEGKVLLFGDGHSDPLTDGGDFVHFDHPSV